MQSCSYTPFFKFCQGQLHSVPSAGTESSRNRCKVREGLLALLSVFWSEEALFSASEGKTTCKADVVMQRGSSVVVYVNSGATIAGSRCVPFDDLSREARSY